MLPLRLVLVRNIRAGTLWSHAKFSSGDGGHKRDDNDTTNQEDTKAAKKVQDKNRKASLELNELLQSMLKEETTRKVSSKAESLDLSKPKSRKKEPRKIPPVTFGEKIVEAAENVAHELGRDEAKTELLEKVAGQTSERPTVQKTPTITPTKSPVNLSELIVGMKIDRSQPDVSGRAQQVRKMLAAEPHRIEANSISASMLRRPSQQRQQREVASPAGLNEGVAFGIFGVAKSQVSSSAETRDDTWSQLQQQELRLAITHPPANIFEEMILWTNQGKLWHFPINNEQGMEVESKVHFSEHVFLERHIEDWCPKRGPVRHFMELVCVGLSKNPYLTVEEKKNHIAWYKQYFAGKEALLREVGAIS